MPVISISRLVSRTAQWHRNAIAVQDGTRACTFSEIDIRSNRLANALIHLGGDPVGRVALLLPNCMEFIECDLAIIKAGKAKVPINPRLADPERDFILSDSGAECLIYHSSLSAFADGIRDRHPTLRHVVCIGARQLGWTLDYEDTVARGAGNCPDWLGSEEDVSTILYTSGTTGRPKGAALSRRSRYSAMLGMLAHEIDVSSGAAMAHVGPLSHGSGSKILAYFLGGARNVVLPSFDPDAFLSAVRKEAITGSFMVPTMIESLVEAAGSARGGTWPSLRGITYGGAPMSPDLIQRAIARFGPVFVQVYGTSEAPHPVTVLSQRQHVDGASRVGRLSSIGREVLTVDVAVVGDDGAAVPDGDVGELWIRGDNLMNGYWGNKEATREAFEGTYYKTGDLAWRDDEGFLHMSGRKKELIISGGLNIYPAEVERALATHPSVAHAAVVGVPDDYWGESVMGYVVLRSGATVTEDQLIEHCRGEIASYKKPRSIRFVDDLPRGSTGKVLKRMLMD
jgi:acyl-CoA synthetase (AMP-forming)/AMP-acid ligase II